MQLLAMLTMLIDHIGLVFFPDEPAWRYVGRLAFPLYAYLLVFGYSRTSNALRYMGRLLLIGVISQVPYMWALHGDNINVVGTLLLGLFVLWLCDKFPSRAVQIGAAAAGCLVAEFARFDYGAYGVLLILIYRYTKDNAALALHFAINLAVMLVHYWFSQILSLLATALVMFGQRFLRLMDKGVPRWLWRVFYPAHMIAIGAVHAVWKLL